MAQLANLLVGVYSVAVSLRVFVRDSQKNGNSSRQTGRKPSRNEAAFSFPDTRMPASGASGAENFASSATIFVTDLLFLYDGASTKRQLRFLLHREYFLSRQ